jgi:pentatricopeptide repeat protein
MEVALLKESALCIDDLVNAFLHQHESQEMQDSGSQAIVDNAVDFVCTGIYAWGRVAPQDRDAPTKAESLLTTLLGTFEKSGQNPSFRPSEDVYSALAYCWSQATNDDRAPERALNWLNVIIENPKMTVSTATYNAVLRAYARQGRVQEVEQLAESIPAEKDVYTYEILVQAWLHSNLSEGPHKAYIALQEGIQNSLQNEDITPLTQLFGRFLNMNKENPKMCQQVLNQIILLQQEHLSLEILQARHFIITMTAWASKGEAEKVEQLFRTMEESHKNGNGRLKPTYQVSIALSE